MEVLSHKFDKLYPDREEESILAVNTASPALLSMEKLKEHNIFCFPVMNADHEQRIVGLLDLVDVCAFVVKLWDEQPEDSVRFDVQFKNALEGKTASDVMNYSKMNDCHFLNSKATLKDVLKVLSLPGVHRVPMMGRGGLLNQKSKRPLNRFITQSDVLRFVASNLDDFGNFLCVPVLGTIGTYPAHTVADDCKTIDTFRELLAKKITGIGVVDKNGKLVGNISARDIGHVVTSNPGAELNSPVGEFLSELRSAGETHDAAITCVGTDSVRAVILKIAENKIHRIYVEDGGVPIGVISLSDICRFLLKGPVDW